MALGRDLARCLLRFYELPPAAHAAYGSAARPSSKRKGGSLNPIEIDSDDGAAPSPIETDGNGGAASSSVAAGRSASHKKRAGSALASGPSSSVDFAKDKVTIELGGSDDEDIVRRAQVRADERIALEIHHAREPSEELRDAFYQRVHVDWRTRKGEDVHILHTHGSWLNDEEVLAALHRALSDACEKGGEMAEQTVVCNLLTPKASQNVGCRVTSQFRYAIWAAHLDESHWCVVLVDLREMLAETGPPSVYFFDPLGGAIPEHLKPLVAETLQQLFRRFKGRASPASSPNYYELMPGVQMQTDMHQCGVYCVWMAHQFLLNGFPRYRSDYAFANWLDVRLESSTSEFRERYFFSTQPRRKARPETIARLPGGWSA